VFVLCCLTKPMELVLPVEGVMMTGKNYFARHQKIKGNLCWGFMRPLWSVMRETDLSPPSDYNNSQRRSLP